MTQIIDGTGFMLAYATAWIYSALLEGCCPMALSVAALDAVHVHPQVGVARLVVSLKLRHNQKSSFTRSCLKVGNTELESVTSTMST